MAESIRMTVVQIQDPVVDKFVGKSLSLFTTLEGENPGGSIKDHMVSGALQKLLSDQVLRPGMILTEASAGSTALSLAHYTKISHIACTLFVPDTHPAKAVERLRSLGAEVRLVDLASNWQPYYDFLEEPGVFPFNQHLDAGKRIYYRELGEKVTQKAGPLDAIIGAVGTAHSLIGASEGMACDPYLATAEPRTEKVSGIRNIDTLRYGEGDPCTPDLFDERILLEASEFFPGDKIMTDHGPIGFAGSFRVTLGGLSRLARSRPQMKSCFVLGSTNRR